MQIAHARILWTSLVASGCVATGCAASAYDYPEYDRSDSGSTSGGEATTVAVSELRSGEFFAREQDSTTSTTSTVERDVPATRTESYAPSAMADEEPNSGIDLTSGGEGWDNDSRWRNVRRSSPAASPPPGRVAQAQPSAGQQGSPTQATDANEGTANLLVYQAEIHLAVFQVQETQEAIVTAARDLGGYLSSQSDTHVTIRVPADKFRDALERIEGSGDVLHRTIEAIEVTEEFRDVSIRLRNAETMRDRLEVLLRQASSTEDALAIEREIQRLTETIEQARGRLRYLQDRISFSTITVRFQARNLEHLGADLFQLPFEWLQSLGLSNLLTLETQQ